MVLRRRQDPKKTSDRNNTPWRDDPELKDLLQQRQNCDSENTIKKLSRKILNRHKTLKNNFFETEAAKIN